MHTLLQSGGGKSELIGFSDADYAGDIETRRSTTGYVFYLANGAVSWSSQRQKLVTLSTNEAEYLAASVATRELVWLRKLLKDIGCPCAEETTLFVDNQSTIQLVKNPVYHKRTKHIDIRYHFVREKIESKDALVEYVPSEKQRANIFTKALPRERFRNLCEKLNLLPICIKRSTAVVLRKLVALIRLAATVHPLQCRVVIQIVPRAASRISGDIVRPRVSSCELAQRNGPLGQSSTSHHFCTDASAQLGVYELKNKVWLITSNKFIITPNPPFLISLKSAPTFPFLLKSVKSSSADVGHFRMGVSHIMRTTHLLCLICTMKNLNTIDIFLLSYSIPVPLGRVYC